MIYYKVAQLIYIERGAADSAPRVIYVGLGDKRLYRFAFKRVRLVESACVK